MKPSTKIILPIIIISALLILLNGCLGTVPDDSPGYNPGSITGRIMVPVDCTECQTSECIPKSNDGVPSHWIPVGDAIVTVIPHATLTDENGYYTLSDIEPGVYYVITATYGNLVLKDIVEPPGVKAGETYDAGTANCESTALGLIVEALLDMGLDTEDIELALEIIKENPKFDDLVDIICCIIEDCGNVTLVCGVDELIQDLIDDEPGYTPLLDSLTILPDSISLCIGATKSIEPYVTFIAHYTGEPDKIVVASCTYSSKDSGIASISGFSVYGESDGSTTIDVSASYTEGDTTVNVTGVVPVRVIDCSDNCIPELESLSVVLGNTQPMTLCNGATQSINSLHIASIIAHYTCGVDEILALSACTYTSENPSIASVSGRSVTGNAVGSTNIVVKYTDGGKTVVATQKVAVEVADCTTLESITVSPNPLNLCAAGTGTYETEHGTITTTAYYSDGFSTIVTPSSYVIGDTYIVASVSAAGLVTSESTVGSTTITVYYEGQIAIATVNVRDCTVPTTLDYITVSPNPLNLCAEGTGTYETEHGTITTTAHYSDGNSMVVDPSSCSYTGYSTSIVASVSAVGLVTSGSSEGTTSITVTYEGKTAIATVNVVDCTTLDYITVETDPSPMNLCAADTGTTETETGTIVTTAHYSDGNSMVVDPSSCSYTGYSTSIVASVSAVGLVTSGSSEGTTSITVTYEGKTAIATVNVVDCTTLDYITVETDPSPMNLCKEGTGGIETGTIVTTAHYSDGNSMVVDPSSCSYTGYSTSIVASVSAVGLVTSGSSEGTTSITVTYEGKTAIVDVTVNDCTSYYNLTMQVYPAGSGTTIPLVGGPYTYSSGTVVSISATAEPGYEFVNWTGDVVADPNSASTTVIMDADKTVTANFIEDTGTVSGKICQHNGNGYGKAWAYFRNTDTNEIYSAQGAPGSGNYSIILPAGNYVLWANKPSGSQCPTSIGYNTNGGNPNQDPNGWICLTVSSAGMHYYSIWVDNAEGSHPGPCVEPPSNAC